MNEQKKQLRVPSWLELQERRQDDDILATIQRQMDERHLAILTEVVGQEGVAQLERDILQAAAVLTKLQASTKAKELLGRQKSPGIHHETISEALGLVLTNSFEALVRDLARRGKLEWVRPYHYEYFRLRDPAKVL